ncbi:MAG: DNA methyltransferase [Anaerolineae bacterium]|nr:DNA methyltransferase [Anaerolineae bacterium]MDW8067785.1 DNA methyltransferase [Anaerolineae bacterium]
MVFRCPICELRIEGPLRPHILQMHGEAAFKRAVLTDKERGISDPEIGARYGISFNTLQQIITEAYGANISVLQRSKTIKRWEPRSFQEETTTVWSFKQRGDWATHNGRYRGNWSPYIPRNVILKYSRPGDLVLDYFVGGGTTAVEAKLLGRRCIARDINPGAVGITLENLRFSPPRSLTAEAEPVIYDPEVRIGDARDLSDIPDNSVDLICAHPPYAGIIRYSTRIPGDLSALSVPDFLREMRKVAQESLRVLKPGGKCAILVGDARRSKNVIPIGFQTIRVFLDTGLVLKELVIKRQHNCRTTGFWYTRSIQHNFLLLAHEYLPIFEKPLIGEIREQLPLWEESPSCWLHREAVPEAKKENLETTTVWIFPEDQLDAEMRRNLIQRFCSGGHFLEVRYGEKEEWPLDEPPADTLFIRCPPPPMTESRFVGYRGLVVHLAQRSWNWLPPGAVLIVEAVDFRSGGRLIPSGLLVYEALQGQRHLSLKEIVIVVPNPPPCPPSDESLQIIHRYLLIYLRN